MSKEIKLVVPTWRPCDYTSKRGVDYWWHPEWVRNLNGSASKIRPIKNKNTGDVDLMMEAKNGNLTFIQGSIQREFKKWHEDRSIDYILLGEDADELLSVDRNEATAEERGSLNKSSQETNTCAIDDIDEYKRLIEGSDG